MMTKAKPQKQAGKTAPPARNTKASAEGDDVYELLLAELEARRVRLRQLLQMVWAEAARPPARRSAEPRVKCGGTRVQRTA
jgi:hypothetical protein